MFIDELQEIRACPEAREWVGDKDFHSAWEKCERADWLLWLVARKVGKKGWPTHQKLTLCTCACVQAIALPLMPADEKDHHSTVEITQQWARGKASLEDVFKAEQKSLRVAIETKYSTEEERTNPHRLVAWAVTRAARTAREALWAPDTVDDAAQASDNSEGALPKDSAHILMCALIRTILKVPE